MAYIQAEIESAVLGRTMQVNLYYPTDLPKEVGNKVKGVITLLHGYSNNGSDWMSFSAAPRYAADNGYILIAPSMDNSFYLNMKHGADFYTYITEELPALLGTMFHIPTAKEKNYIAGLSMGGYGALRIGLANPERYAACGSFSGCIDLGKMLACGKDENHPHSALVHKMFDPVFGADLSAPDDADLFLLTEKLAALPKEEQLRIFCTCGRQDTETEILQQNHNYRDLASSLPLDFTFMEWDGVHEWNFWDRSLVEFIGHIQNSDYAAKKRYDWTSPETT